VDRKEKVIVGVNDYLADEKPIEILRIDESVASRQDERLRRLRASRSNEEVERKLSVLRKAAGGGENLMPHLIGAVKAYATLGEICDALRGVFGVYTEAAIT
jgi:methylmalonyl-CoA mutase N-terminal domain/subunit